MSLKIMPQELEVWYLIPSLRKELANIFIKIYKLNQKQAAQILGITESAVSQYIKSKRAKEIIFSEQEKEEIRKTAEKIIKDQKNIRNYFYELSSKLRGSKGMCAIHKKHDTNLPVNCDLCKQIKRKI